MLEKIVPIEIPEGMKHIHFAFPPAPHSGKVTLRIENLGKSYGENRIIGDFGVEIDRGMKVALVGPNGAGKSTLMRLIAGTDRDYSGSINFGSGVVAAYFAQDTAEKMEGIHTVEAELESVCPNELLPKVRNMLGAFLFRGDDVEKPLNVLSGGERSRLALLKMLLHPANLLILDEPTNHLDLTSKDVLLEALRAFQGTVLFVSHDRGFIEELADRVLELESGASPRLYVGDYRYYLEKKAALADEMAATPSPAASGAGARTELRAENRPDRPVAGPGGMPDTAIGSRKAADAPGSSLQVPIFPLSWEEEKARKARIRKVAKREQEILDRLESIGAQKLAAEREMSLPRNYSDGATMKKLVDSLGELEREAAGLNEEWILVAEELASLS
jgi:ATP-binding cassette subfamily F protein 3